MNKSIAWALGLVSIIAGGALLAMTVAPPNLSKALEAQHRLVLERPQDADVLNDLGNLLVLAHRSDDAEQAYLRAIELAPDNPQPHFNLALLLQQEGRPNAAMKQLEKVLKLRPDNAWAHYQVGAIHESRGDKRQAVRHYGRAFALEPQLASVEINPQIIENQLVVESMLRGYDEAVGRPLAPKVYDERGRIVDLMVAEEMMTADNEAAEDASADNRAAENRLGERSAADPAGPQPAWSGESAGDEESALRAIEDEDDEPRAVGTEGSAVRVLTPDTIERGGSLGQATPLGSGRSTRGSRSSTGSSGRTTVVPRSNRSPRTTTGSQTPRPRYVPPANSTGSLDLELIPGPDSWREPFPTQPAG